MGVDNPLLISKMHIVDDLFVGDEYRTKVWVAEKAWKELKRFSQRGDGLMFLQKLEYYAKAGFQAFEGAKNPIRSEGHGVWRVRHSVSSLFRLIGFYDDGKAAFIAIDAFTKSGTRLSAAERKRIDRVAEVKRDGLWKRR